MRALLAGVFAALVAACVIACARPAQAPVRPPFAPSYEFNPPPWQRAPDPHNRNIWKRSDGTADHVVEVFPIPGDDVRAYAANVQARIRARGNTVIDEGVLRICDAEPARRWRVIRTGEHRAIVTHYLVTPITGGMAMASYAHPQDVAPRREALHALETVCPGATYAGVFEGWKSRYMLMGTDGVETSPDGRSSFAVAITRRSNPAWQQFLRPVTPPGRIVRNRTQPCGASRVRVIETRRGDDTIEMSFAVVHMYGYRFTYTHPTEQAPFAPAERALTLFCRPPAVERKKPEP